MLKHIKSDTLMETGFTAILLWLLLLFIIQNHTYRKSTKEERKLRPPRRTITIKQTQMNTCLKSGRDKQRYTINFLVRVKQTGHTKQNKTCLYDGSLLLENGNRGVRGTDLRHLQQRSNLEGQGVWTNVKNATPSHRGSIIPKWNNPLKSHSSAACVWNKK